MTLFTGQIEGQHIRAILGAVTEIVDECRVFLENDRIRIRGTDPADVALVTVTIQDGAFDNAQIDQGDVCWDFVEMAEMVNTVGKDEEVHLTLEEHDLHIEMLDLSFTVSLIDPNSISPDRKKPEFDLSGEIVLDSNVFKRGVRAADLIAEHVEFGINEDEDAFYMKAKGDTNRVILQRKKQDLVTLSTDPISSIYSVEYLKDMCKAIPDEKNIRIDFEDDFPAEISFEIADNNASVTYFLAPRVEPDQ